MRPLGSRGPELSLIGLGAWALGGRSSVDSWGDQDDDTSLATIRVALDEGVNWIDTAPSYGLGHSEVVVGRALRGRRDEAFIATKCGVRWNDAGATWRCGTKASIRLECEESLRRLDVEHLDLLQIHFPPDDVPVEESWTALCELADEGKTRHIGVSNFDIDLVRRCQAIRRVDSLQAPYSLVHPEIEVEMMPFCAEQGIGIIAFGALSQGFLTGSFDPARLHSDDFRHNEWMRVKLPASSRIVEALRPLAESRGVTVGQLAIGWAATHAAVTGVIVGARSPEQVTQNVAAAAVVDARLRDEVEEALGRTG